MAHRVPTGIEWVPKSGGATARFAVLGGLDGNNQVYVIRASHLNGMIPGKLHIGHSCAYVSYGGKEIAKPVYEVLVAPPDTLSWVKARAGRIPSSAIEGGKDPNGDTYYIGRVTHAETVTPGKVHPKYELCFIPYGGLEWEYEKYEILVENALGRLVLE